MPSHLPPLKLARHSLRKKVTLLDNIKANIDAIKRKNVELSSELSIAREKLDKVTLEAVVMKNDIDDLKTAVAKHEEEMKSILAIAGTGSIEEVKNMLRGIREIKEQEQALIEHHEKILISQG